MDGDYCEQAHEIAERIEHDEDFRQKWAYDEDFRGEYVCRLIAQALRAGNEPLAAQWIEYLGSMGRWRSANMLRLFYQDFKDSAILYRLIIDVYIMDGYAFSRKVMQAAKRIAKSVPDDERLPGLPAGDVVTVYRASASDAYRVRNEISWTINKNVAIWFGYRNNRRYGDDPLHIYRGEIERGDIIAYSNEREEFEVMQHQNVKNVTLIEVTADEVDRAFTEYDEQTRAQLDKIMGKHDEG